MKIDDQIYPSQILYTEDCYPVIVVDKTDETVTVYYKGKNETRDLTIIGEKLFTVPPLTCRRGQKTPLSSNIDGKGSNVKVAIPRENKTNVFTQEATRSRVKGGWISDYHLQNISNPQINSRDDKVRSTEPSTEIKVLGRNSGHTGIRPSTVTGYSQQSRKPLICKKRKRR